MENIHRHFLKIQFLSSGAGNAVLNSLFFWAGNREQNPLSFPAAAVDVFITCIFVTLLVTLPTVHFTRKALQAGMPLWEQKCRIDRLPGKRWALCLVLWLFSTVAMEAVIAGIYAANGWRPIGFHVLLLLKFLWCGLLGGSLGALVGAKYLRPGKPERPTPLHGDAS